MVEEHGVQRCFQQVDKMESDCLTYFNQYYVSFLIFMVATDYQSLPKVNWPWSYLHLVSVPLLSHPHLFRLAQSLQHESPLYDPSYPTLRIQAPNDYGGLQCSLKGRSLAFLRRPKNHRCLLGAAYLRITHQFCVMLV